MLGKIVVVPPVGLHAPSILNSNSDVKPKLSLEEVFTSCDRQFLKVRVCFKIEHTESRNLELRMSFLH